MIKFESVMMNTKIVWITRIRTSFKPTEFKLFEVYNIMVL